jgi:hypothetical protein
VAATDRRRWLVPWGRRPAALAALLSLAATLSAATLPEERVQAMYHSYDGGGVEVTGPALNARMNFGSTVSATADYYVDSISAASIDVVTSASPYSEQRTEYGVGIEWLYGDAIVSAGYANSDESDYQADTYSLGVAQDVFAGMTTVALAYAHGDDVVGRVDTDFEDKIDRDSYLVGVNQVLTPRLLANLTYEAITEDGFLSNPYRSARILGAQVPERYPRTRTSHAVALGGIWSPGRDDSVRGSYRYFTDTWDIGAHTFELGYSRYINPRWIADLRLRYYTQDAASFYSDNFDQEYNYMARDKELSTFDSLSAGGALSWDLARELPLRLQQAKLTLSYDYIRFSYDDFTDVRDGELYEFNSHVFQLYFSAWY